MDIENNKNVSLEKVTLKINQKNKLINNKNNNLKNASSNSAIKQSRENNFIEVPDNKINNSYLSDKADVLCNKIVEEKVKDNKVSNQNLNKINFGNNIVKTKHIVNVTNANSNDFNCNEINTDKITKIPSKNSNLPEDNKVVKNPKLNLPNQRKYNLKVGDKRNTNKYERKIIFINDNSCL